jgi:hypothetical protein
VSEGVHGQQRRHAGDVAEVVLETALGEGRTRRGFDRQEVYPGIGHERKRDPAQVGAPTAAADHDVRALLAGQGELLLGLEADHGLVEEHVVQHRPQGVVRVLPVNRVTDGVADCPTEGSGLVRIVDRRGDDSPPPDLHHRSPVGLLIVRGPHHVDLAFEVEEGGGEGEGAPPLPSAGLGGQPGDPLLLVVEGLRDGGVGLV